MADTEDVRRWRMRVAAATAEAHQILAVYESSPSRVVILGDLLQKLSGLPVDVQDYFRESTRCLEHNVLRAAVVLSWAGFFHVVCEKLFSTHENSLRAARNKWTFKDITELKENHAEAQILDAAKEVGLFGKAKQRVYQGHLSTRNQCAHPTLYQPSLNIALGYVDEMITETTKYI